LDELAMEGHIRGIKLYTCYQNIDLESDKMTRMLQLAERYKLPLAFHVGNSHTARKNFGRETITDLVKASHLEKLMSEHPKTDFILCHLGKPYLDDTITTVKRFPNAYTEMSGLLNSFDEPELIPESINDVTMFVGECGPEKLLFGTDFPVQSYEHSILFIEEGMKQYTTSEKQKVYYENAKRILRI
jgi:uncharacterized protein